MRPGAQEEGSLATKRASSSSSTCGCAGRPSASQLTTSLLPNGSAFSSTGLRLPAAKGRTLFLLHCVEEVSLSAVLWVCKSSALGSNRKPA